jgi:hypothetical protein
MEYVKERVLWKEIERRRKETAFSNSSMIIHFVFPSLI